MVKTQVLLALDSFSMQLEQEEALSLQQTQEVKHTQEQEQTSPIKKSVQVLSLIIVLEQIALQVVGLSYFLLQEVVAVYRLDKLHTNILKVFQDQLTYLEHNKLKAKDIRN